MRETYFLLAILAIVSFMLQIEWLLFAAIAILVALALAEAFAPTAPKAVSAGRAAQAPQQIVVYQPTAPSGFFDSFIGTVLGHAPKWAKEAEHRKEMEKISKSIEESAKKIETAQQKK